MARLTTEQNRAYRKQYEARLAEKNALAAEIAALRAEVERLREALGKIGAEDWGAGMSVGGELTRIRRFAREALKENK